MIWLAIVLLYYYWIVVLDTYKHISMLNDMLYLGLLQNGVLKNNVWYLNSQCVAIEEDFYAPALVLRGGI